MTITFKKAGETVAKAAMTAATKGSKAAALPKPPPGTKLTPIAPGSRAVDLEEAPFIEPAKAPSTQSLMPWRGWFSRFLQSNMGDEKYQKYVRNVFFFLPDDIYDLQQSPKPSQKIPISKTDPSITHMYRYPSPGSQKPVRLPEFEEGEDPYDTAYFKKDTRRRYLSSELGDKELEKAKLMLMNPDDPSVQEEIEKLEAGPESSPGNKGRFATGPTDFDPSGLRATMSVTWDKLEESLDAHMPDHLPTPVWTKHEQEIIAWHQERDLPIPIGGYYQALKVPVERRVARW